ncbi:MAG: helix-turn-helix transcriptional regulator [Verrucomicrobia bacterium]|nr:helix-turn-helix transcriptional regulator [Verrucomicrobiota bacterium]MCH8514060.1 AraC family transcriptional regulator [Kiritimatiellia bacterium]
MKTDKHQDYPTGDYFPHVLSGAEARRQSGRRAPGHHKPSGSLPWYTTYMIDQGPFTVMDPGAEESWREGPAVICLPPFAKSVIKIPASTLFSWLEWGAMRLPLCARDTANASRKYPEGHSQPQPEEIWGRSMPLQLPESCNQPTAGMMVRVNASWWKGGAERMLANAELSLWIARYLFPPEAPSDAMSISNLFPEAGPDFAEALNLLKKSFAMGLDIRDWALALEISSRSLQRWCRQETGLSPQGVLDALRMQRAERLLERGDLKLPEIGRNCGFASAAAFSAWFANKKGVSPGRWRKGFKEKPHVHR